MRGVLERLDVTLVDRQRLQEIAERRLVILHRPFSCRDCTAKEEGRRFLSLVVSLLTLPELHLFLDLGKRGFETLFGTRQHPNIPPAGEPHVPHRFLEGRREENRRGEPLCQART